jgi:hypothetical protein
LITKGIKMTKQQWLEQIVMCDGWGRPPSLADVPMHYMSREDSFKKRKISENAINETYKMKLKEMSND